MRAARIGRAPVFQRATTITMYADYDTAMMYESCDSSTPRASLVESRGLKRFYCANDYFSSDEEESDNEVVITLSKKKRCTGLNKYDNSYLSFGFVENPNRKTPYPLCLICGAVLPNKCMKKDKLRRHFMIKHAEYSDKPASFFQKSLEALQRKLEMGE